MAPRRRPAPRGEAPQARGLIRPGGRALVPHAIGPDRAASPEMEEGMSSKQPKTKVPTDADLKGNPGIGQSKGMTISGGDPEDLQSDAESTFEGDTMNETKLDGGIDPNHTGRTNK